MTRVTHFFLLHLPGRSDEPWPIEELRRADAEASVHSTGDWHLVPAGPLLVGWSGAPHDPRQPFFLHAGDLAAPEDTGPDLALHLVHNDDLDDFPLDGVFAACAVDPVHRAAAVATDPFGLFPLYR